MNPGKITLLSRPCEIQDYVMDLWSDGPVRHNHAAGGMVDEIVKRFSQVPRVFFEASDQRLEWTHFSPWWGAIQIADYENKTIRDLRYLHEIYHSATMPYARGMNLATMAARNAQNEREASTFSEIAIYLEIPELRDLSFEHDIFADRFLFARPRIIRNDDLFERWRRQRDVVFQELLYARLNVVLAEDHEIDAKDPQTVWLRRYPEQGDIWNKIWSERHHMVDDAMVTLRERCVDMGPVEAGKRHLDWMMSDAITDGTSIPFRREAAAFRDTFDALIAHYDEAMQHRNEDPVRHIAL